MKQFIKQFNTVIFAFVACLLIIVIVAYSNSGSTDISSTEIEKNSAIWTTLENENQRLARQIKINERRQDNLERRNELLRELFMSGENQLQKPVFPALEGNQRR